MLHHSVWCFIRSCRSFECARFLFLGLLFRNIRTQLMRNDFRQFLLPFMPSLAKAFLALFFRATSLGYSLLWSYLSWVLAIPLLWPEVLLQGLGISSFMATDGCLRADSFACYSLCYPSLSALCWSVSVLHLLLRTFWVLVSFENFLILVCLQRFPVTICLLIVTLQLLCLTSWGIVSIASYFFLLLCVSELRRGRRPFCWKFSISSFRATSLSSHLVCFASVNHIP